MKRCTINIPENFMYHTQEDVVKKEAELVETFEVLFDKISQLAFANPNILLFYRGQNMDYKIGSGNSERTSLLPSIYRKISTPVELTKRWEKLRNAENILYTCWRN